MGGLGSLLERLALELKCLESVQGTARIRNIMRKPLDLHVFGSTELGVLGASWSVLGPSWSILRASGEPSGTSLDRIGAFLVPRERLGTVLEGIGSVSGTYWGDSGLPWVVLGASWEHVGVSGMYWERIGRS